MKVALIYIWNIISEFGVSEEHPEENNLVRWYNRVSLMSAFIGFFLIFVAITQDYFRVYLYVLLFVSAIDTITLLLNYFGKIYAARYVVTIGPTIWANGMYVLLGGNFGHGVVTVASLAISYVAYKNTPVLRAVFMSCQFLCYILSAIYIGLVGAIFENYDVPFDEIIVFFGAIIWIIVVLISHNHDRTVLMNNLKIKNQELKNTTEELERFTHIASHDLKSPLRTIISFVGLAERNLRNGNLSGAEDNLGFVKSGAQQMNYLVQDILELTKINMNENIDYELVDMNRVFQAACHNLTLEINEKNAHVQCDPLHAFLGNPIGLLLVFQNIIQNAIKYNDNVNPEVRISSYQGDNGHLIIKFRDNGIGIDKEYVDQIFQFFKRLHTSEKYQGTGMGLGLCKKIIKNYDGDISVDSIKGLGSTFIVELPYRDTLKAIEEMEVANKSELMEVVV